MSPISRLEEEARLDGATDGAGLGARGRGDGEVVDARDAAGDEAGLVAGLGEPGQHPGVGRVATGDLDVDEHAPAERGEARDDAAAGEGGGGAEGGEADAAGEERVLEELGRVEELGEGRRWDGGGISCHCGGWDYMARGPRCWVGRLDGVGDV